MANIVKARETIQVIREHPERLYMGAWACGAVNPTALHWSECGTIFCYFGWRCVLDGLRPDYNIFGRATGQFIKADGECVDALDYGMVSLELTGKEALAIAYRRQITNVDDLEWVVEAIIADDWARCRHCLAEGCEDCHYRGIVRPSERASDATAESL